VTYHVSAHAIEAYNLFYPTADRDVLVGAVEAGLLISNPIALRMVGRKSPHRSMGSGSYVLHVERTGLFVLSDPEGADKSRVTVITFLRFYSFNQYTLAKRLYPKGAAPPTATATWNKREEIQ